MFFRSKLQICSPEMRINPVEQEQEPEQEQEIQLEPIYSEVEFAKQETENIYNEIDETVTTQL